MVRYKFCCPLVKQQLYARFSCCNGRKLSSCLVDLHSCCTMWSNLRWSPFASVVVSVQLTGSQADLVAAASSGNLQALNSMSTGNLAGLTGDAGMSQSQVNYMFCCYIRRHCTPEAGLLSFLVVHLWLWPFSLPALHALSRLLIKSYLGAPYLLKLYLSTSSNRRTFPSCLCRASAGPVPVCRYCAESVVEATCSTAFHLLSAPVAILECMLSIVLWLCRLQAWWETVTFSWLSCSVLVQRTAAHAVLYPSVQCSAEILLMLYCVPLQCAYTK